MGDMGIDKWCWRMEEHKREGHHIIKYKYDEIEHGLLLKEQRVKFWEHNKRIPTFDELSFLEV